MLTTHLQTSDVQPDLYTRLYDPATFERSPMLAWVVHAWTRHVAENGSPAARASGAELNRLWDQLSPDEKLVATFLNGKLDYIAKINEKAPESLSEAILAPKE